MRRPVPVLKAAFAASVLVFATLSAVAAQTLGSDHLTFFRIGTGPTATSSYALGTAISAGISKPPGSRQCDDGGLCGVPGLIAVAQTKVSSLSAIDSMLAGDLESAIVPADVAYWVYNGGGPFEERFGHERLRVIANLVPADLHIVVDSDSGIDTVFDLAGKRVSLGPFGSETYTSAEFVLRAHDLTTADVQVSLLKPGPATDALFSGQVDAMFLLEAAPVEAIEELAKEFSIRLLPVALDQLSRLQKLYPFVTETQIAPGTYYGVIGTPTVSLGVKWVVLAEQPEDLIEQITKALWRGNTRDLFLQNNPRSQFADPSKAMIDGGVPLHPGAKKYYDEAGDELTSLAASQKKESGIE